MAVLIRTFSSGIHTHPVSWNCAHHLRMELPDGSCFSNLVLHCRWTIVPRKSFWITLYIYCSYYEHLLSLFSHSDINETLWMRRDGVLMAVAVKIQVFLYVTLCRLVNNLPTFRKKRLQVFNPHGVTFHKTCIFTFLKRVLKNLPFMDLTDE